MLTKQASQYDSDFFAWTQEQAALLRSMPDADARLDIMHLADEIEDMGRAEVNKIRSLLMQTVAHLLKLAIDPESRAADGWHQEAIALQADAVLAFSPGLKHKIKVRDIWDVACNNAVRSLERYDVAIPNLPRDCPLSLDNLLQRDFDPKVAVDALAHAIKVGSTHQHNR